MTRIGLISDSHNFIDEETISHLRSCDEIWHAGDFGSISIAQKLLASTGLPLKGVYGNIDGKDIRSAYPESLTFTCEEVNIFIKHIGGYPGRYAPGVKKEILSSGAQLFISGHSHILKVMFDKDINCLHINPGAAGKQGWHTVRTIVRFVIDGKEIRDCEVVELGRSEM